MPAPTIRPELQLSPELEKKRFITVDEAAKLKSISRDTFKRHYSHLIHELSPRRRGVRLGDVLAD